MKAGHKQPAGARKRVAPTPKKQSMSASGRIGPFKPTVRVPRILPVASPTSASHETSAVPPTGQAPSTSGNSAGPVRFVSNDAGLLERVGHEADEALAIGKRVLTMLNVETKCITYSTLAASLTNTGLIFNPLSAIGQGDNDSMRDGDSLKLKGWDGHLLFTRGGVDAIVAWAFVQEGPTFLTASNQVFEDTGSALAPLSNPEWDSRGTFKVLHKGVHALTASDPFKIVGFNHKFNHDVQYYNNSTSVYEGKVSLFVTTSHAGGGSQPTLNFDGQMSWVDN